MLLQPLPPVATPAAATHPPLIKSAESLPATRTLIASAPAYTVSLPQQLSVPVLLESLPRSVNGLGVDLNRQLQTIGTSLSGATQPISLKEAISKSVSASPQLAVSYRSIQQQEWLLIARRRDWYPTLNLSAQPLWGYQFNSSVANYQPYQNSALNDLLGIPITTWQGSYTNATQVAPTSTLSWAFFKPQRTSLIKSQAELLNQQRYLYAVSARSLILQVQQNYYMLQSLKELIGSYVELTLGNLQEVKVMTERFPLRLVTVSDLEQSRTQTLNQMYQLLQYIYQYQSTSATLANLMGQDTTFLFNPIDPFQGPQPWPLTLDDTVQQGLAMREEVKANLAASQSYDWDATALIQQYLPNLYLFASGTANQATGMFNSDLSGISKGPSTGSVWNPTSSVGIGLSWQIFDGGVFAAQSSSRRVLAQQQRDQAQQTRLDVTSEVKTAYAAYRTQLIAIENSNSAVRSALAAQDAARARYQVGIGDITTLVQANSLYGSALFNLANAQMSYYSAVSALYRYSAIWPPGTEELVDLRAEELR